MDAFLKRLTKEAGTRAWKRFGKDGVHHTKSKNPTDAVTKADIATERYIVSEIRKRYPTHGIIAEESGSKKENAEYVWIIDPIDGTLNFATGIPLFGTMVALMRRGKITIGAIYIPVNGELFFARRGKGAYLNGRRIKASRISRLARSRGAISSTMSDRTLNFCRELHKAIRGKNTYMSAFGSLAVASSAVAAGRRDWYVSSSPHIHDNAAPSLILEEAGYRVTDVKGKNVTVGTTGIVAAVPRLHKILLALTKKTL